jgi:outer membrane protein TolC
VLSALGEAGALAEAWEAVADSHAAQSKEFQYRLISPIRYLESLQELQEARRQLTQAQYEAKRRYLRFKAITGEIPA